MFRAVVEKINWALIIFVIVYNISHAVGIGNGDGKSPWWIIVVVLALGVGLIYEIVTKEKK